MVEPKALIEIKQDLEELLTCVREGKISVYDIGIDNFALIYDVYGPEHREVVLNTIHKALSGMNGIAYSSLFMDKEYTSKYDGRFIAVSLLGIPAEKIKEKIENNEFRLDGLNLIPKEVGGKKLNPSKVSVCVNSKSYEASTGAGHLDFGQLLYDAMKSRKTNNN